MNQINNHIKISEINQYCEYLNGINLKITINNSKHIVIFCPWFPESQWFNNDIINYLTTQYWVSSIYPQYSWTWDSDWTFLKNDPKTDIEKIINWVRSWKFKVDTNAHITLIWSSFWWWVALSLARNNEIGKVIALSPLTANSSTVNRESLLGFIEKERYVDYRIDNEWYTQLKDNNLIKIPDKYPEWKVIIWAIDGDPEINFSSLKEESTIKKANILDAININNWEKKHLSRNVINRATSSTKETIFSSLNIINDRIKFVNLFIEWIFEVLAPNEVYGILTHGSWYYKEWHPRDFDFILIVNQIWDNDVKSISNVKTKFMNEWIDNLDITIIYHNKLEIWWIKWFNLDTHGNYYSEIFKNTELLYWKNPFQLNVKKKINTIDIKSWFRWEVGKYTDRLNRIIVKNPDPEYFKKYIERMFISLGISEGIVTAYKSNFLNREDILNIANKLPLHDINTEEINNLFVKTYRDYNDWQECYKIYNNIHLSTLKMNTINIKNTALSSILLKICNISDNILIAWSKTKLNIIDPQIRIISCAAFEKNQRNKLDENLKSLNTEQLNKLAYLNIIVGQINQYFIESFWETLPLHISYGDYWVTAENIEYLISQYEINSEWCKKIFGQNVIIDRLSDDFGETQSSYNQQYNIELIKSNMIDYWLQDNFIDWYLKSTLQKNWKELSMIWSSITEHLNLSQQIIEKRNNSIVVYIGNSQKIRLMHQFIKQNENHSIIFIGICT